jgi:recombination protein RecA
MSRSLKEIEALVNRLNKESGGEFAHRGDYVKQEASIPTGVLALDVALGTNGYPRGAIIGIYGPRDIGKSVLGHFATASGQRMGLGTAVVAYEQKWHPKWVQKFGVDPEQVIVTRPDTAEKAFQHLYTLISEPIIDLIVFDSLGAILGETEVYGTATKDAKAKVGGQAGLITHGVKRLPYQVWKGQKTVIMLNQVRQNMDYGGYKQPGGEALEHHEEVIIELKNGGDRFEVKDPAGKKNDVIQYGQEVAAVIKRNQRSEGSKITARYDFYNKPLEGHEVGIDTIKDIINTAIRVGTFTKSGAWFEVPMKDGTGKNFQAKPFAEYINAYPTERDRIRKLVLEAVNK